MIFKNLLLTALVFPMVMLAQNLVKNGDGETGLDNWNKAQVQVVTENPRSGKACFKTIGTSIVSSELIPVDTAKTYKISGWFKSVDNKKTFLYFGMLSFDADRGYMPPNTVNAMEGSETELAEGCTVNDIVLKVKDASKWDIKNSRIALEADNSGEFKDLPNHKITSPIMKIEQKGKVWEVTLAKPCNMVFPANTPIRIQKDGGAYPVSYANFQSPEWREFTAEVKGEAKSGIPSNQFWPKTKYVQIIILAFNGGMIYFDDVKFEEVK